MHEYYIDENECQASPDMKDAFVLCRVTRRDDWALENDNGVGNRNPHPQHLSDAVTAVVVVEKQEEATSSGICAGVVVVEKQEEASSSSICAGVVVVEKQEDTTALGICAGEPNHVGTPASAELSNDVAPTEFMAHSPNSESEMNAWLEELLVDLSSNPAVDTGSAVPVEQDVESANLQNPSSVDPKMEPDNASPIQNGMDGTDYLNGDFYSMFDFNDAFAAYSMMETDHFISTNNSEGTWNGEVQVHQGTQGREVQSHAGNCYTNLPDENADNGIIVRRRNRAASSASSSASTRRMKLKVGVNRMVTSNSETINQTIKFADNSGRMRSFKQSDATRSSENLSNKGNLRGIKCTFRSSARFSILFACVCMIGVIAAVLHGYYRSDISL
ncbi:hypothetical protein QOZ80_1AG0004820 [Eleusine coracana subsp. coracana]|nr:hypothetical protein QOZ80_1AG0004820 [Eleusine coracana subsp. coracana]